MSHSDYRDILRSRLQLRLKRNPRYSLRAYAKDLGVSPGRLSEILSGKQGLSASSATKIAQRLGLNQVESSHFCNLVEAQDARSLKKKILAQKALQNEEALSLSRKILSEAEFSPIASWVHMAIMELTNIVSDLSVDAIAKRLGLARLRVSEAFNALVKGGFLIKRKSKWEQTEKNLSTTEDLPSSVIVSYHQEILDKAAIAIEQQSVSERDFSSLMISLNESELKEYKELIRAFRKKINNKAESSTTSKDQIYNLSIQFFRITERERL